MMKVKNDAGEEVEVYTADEVNQRVTDEVTKKEGEFTKTKTDLEGTIAEKDKALKERAGEFAQFRRLSDDDKAKLSEAQKTIYENGLALQEEREKNQKAEETRIKTAVEASLKAKAGTDTKLFDKLKETYAIINIDATTTEDIEKKTQMALGMIAVQSPDLVASVAGFNGGFQPPKKEQKDGESFADTDAGKGIGKELGLTLETPKK